VLDIRQEGRAGVGQLHAAAAALEQLLAEFPL